MKKILFLLLFIMTSILAAESKQMTVYKSPYCGCCTKWVDIMKSKGLKVKTIKTNDMNKIKTKFGIKSNMASCHTAIIDGYIVEGHVDYSAIKKMLEQRPNIVGLTVPGMPLGSPGMEQDNMKQAYNVLAIQKDNILTIYEKH